MSKAVENLLAAQSKAMAIRPKVGGFPHLAEVLRLAGVLRNEWFLPSCQSLYHTPTGSVVIQGTPLLNGPAEVPPFDREALVNCIRLNQVGKSTFPEFLTASWRAGVVRYEVDFIARTVVYRGSNGEEYLENYPPVDLEEWGGPAQGSRG